MGFFLFRPVLNELTRATARGDRSHIIYSPLSVPCHQAIPGDATRTYCVKNTRPAGHSAAGARSAQSFIARTQMFCRTSGEFSRECHQCSGDWCPPWHRLQTSWAMSKILQFASPYPFVIHFSHIKLLYASHRPLPFPMVPVTP